MRMIDMVDKKYIYTGLMALYFIVTVIIYQATENNDAQVVIFTLSPLFAIILGILALNSFGVKEFDEGQLRNVLGDCRLMTGDSLTIEALTQNLLLFGLVIMV